MVFVVISVQDYVRLLIKTWGNDAETISSYLRQIPTPPTLRIPHLSDQLRHQFSFYERRAPVGALRVPSAVRADVSGSGRS